MSRSIGSALLLGALLSAAGCTTILGGFDFEGTATSNGGAGGTSSTSSSTASGGGGTGGTSTCVNPATDCPPTGHDCIVAVCQADKCATQVVETPPGTDPEGNCQKRICDINGDAQTTADPADIEDDGNPCTEDTCNAQSQPVHTPIPGVCPNDQICGNVDGPNAGKCVECNLATQANDCPSSICQDNACVPATCGDSVKNGSETDVDCGGSVCGDCADGKSCNFPSDCVSKVCG